MADSWLLTAFSHPEEAREELLANAQQRFSPVVLAEVDHLYRLQAQAAASIGVLLPAPPEADPTDRLVLKVVVFDGEVARVSRNALFFNANGVWLMHHGTTNTNPETGERFHLLVGYPATPSGPTPSTVPGEAP